MKLQYLPGLVGLLGIIFAEIACFTNLVPVRQWFYSIIWWSYILFIDGLIYYIKKDSLLITRTRSFLRMLAWSVIIWLVFELYNLRLNNWHYENITSVTWQRWLGYAISFSTVLPGIFETAEFLETIGIFKRLDKYKVHISSRVLWSFLVIGILCLILPAILPKYFFPLVWLAFIFTLEPVNYYLGQASLLKQGNLRRIVILFTAGLICGFLWEFWNYWAQARWVYSLPYFHGLKLFEMPLLGYLGFPPFAWECYLMYEFTHLTREYSVPLKILTWILMIAFSLMCFGLIDLYTVKSFI